MQNKYLSPLFGFVILTSAASLHAEDSAVGAAIEKFRGDWKSQRGHMRPLEDMGWKARMEAFHNILSMGRDVVPGLIAALSETDDEVRVFAAQALAFYADPRAKPALEKALTDENPKVRMYAIDGLSMFGKLPETESYNKLRDEDRNRDVKSHMKFAQGRDDDPNAAAMRKLMVDYSLSDMDTARLGEEAPDFTLKDATGKEFKLSDFRGKKAVILVFVYGDT